MLFQKRNNQLSSIQEIKFKLEKDVQSLAEANLGTIFGLRFLATEFQLNNLRVDTLAFDDETRSFVIIEYKRDRSFSVIDQGYAYLALLLNNKAEFILEYNETQKDNLKRDDIDWSQSRVFFVADSFTTHQRQAINFRDLPIELWEAKQYSGDLVSFNQLKAQTGSESIKTITKNPEAAKVNKEVKVITVDDHFKGSRAQSRELYENLKDKLLSLDSSLQENPRIDYIGFSRGSNGSKTLVYVRVRAGNLRLDIPRIYPKDVKDPLGKLSYQGKSLERYNTPVSTMTVDGDDDVGYAYSVFRQII